MRSLFFGGIHPAPKKDMSAATAALQTVAPNCVVIPMQQHIGAPCTPLVAVGDVVRRGQKIGDGEGLCSPVHASVSGTVTAVEPRPHLSGKAVLSVVIENDRLNTTVALPLPETENDVLQCIREAGIVGMGGAAFPSDVKALSAMRQAVNTVLINACECEPYITSDDAVMRTAPQSVLEGAMLLHRLLQPTTLVIAVEDNKPEAIAALRDVLPQYPAVELRILPTRYPQGGEKQLIQAVTGREVPAGALPMAVGCAVFNVVTTATIYRAVSEGAPLTERIVTVSGEGVANPQNFVVPIGTPLGDVIDAAGGLADGADRVLCGGPMMGIAQKDLSAPVMKGTNAILCLPKAASETATNCLRCGRCLTVCPMLLQPLYLYRAANHGDHDELTRLNVSDCIECGCCSYACPARLPLTETFRRVKSERKGGE